MEMKLQKWERMERQDGSNDKPCQTHQEGRGVVTSLEDSTSKLESDGREQDWRKKAGRRDWRKVI